MACFVGVAVLASKRRKANGWALPATLLQVVLSGAMGLWLLYVPAPAAEVGEANVKALWEIERGGPPGTTAGEYTPIWVRGLPTVAAGAVRATPGAEVRVMGKVRNRVRFEVKAARAVRVTYGALYFPGWSARVGGEAVAVGPDEHGLVAFEVPAGKSEAVVDFVDTGLRRGAWCLGLVGMGIVVLVLLSPLRGSRECRVGRPWALRPRLDAWRPFGPGDGNTGRVAVTRTEPAVARRS